MDAMDRTARDIANETAKRINEAAPKILDPQYPRYVAQGLFERVIEELQAKV
jgi:hypothetical protein